MLISTLTVVRIAVLFLLIIVFVFPISTAQRTSTATTESFWTAGAPMPTPRTEVTAAVLKDDIYVIGGFDESSQVTDIVEVIILQITPGLRQPHYQNHYIILLLLLMMTKYM